MSRDCVKKDVFSSSRAYIEGPGTEYSAGVDNAENKQRRPLQRSQAVKNTYRDTHTQRRERQEREKMLRVYQPSLYEERKGRIAREREREKQKNCDFLGFGVQ